MNEDGILRCKYILEDNTELMEKTLVMVQKDITAQWLAGDELKRDQFKFIYKVVRIIYDSALRDLLLNEDHRVLEVVIPNLVAYHSILLIRSIEDRKEEEKKKEVEKMVREGKTVTFANETSTEEKKGTMEEQIIKKRLDDKLNTSNASHFNSEAQREKELNRIEIETWGVSFQELT